MKKALTIILLVVCGLIANILINTAVMAAWFNSGWVLWIILLGTAAAAATTGVCALGVMVCRKLRVRRRTLLICAQAPALAIAAILYLGVLVDYIRIMERVSAGEMFDGLERGLTVAFYQMFAVIFITVLLTTAALALTLYITYMKDKDKRKRGAL